MIGKSGPRAGPFGWGVWNLLLRVYRTEVERLAKCGSKKREGRPGMRIFSGVKLTTPMRG